jgi:hypothetical protein
MAQTNEPRRDWARRGSGSAFAEVLNATSSNPLPTETQVLVSAKLLKEALAAADKA